MGTDSISGVEVKQTDNSIIIVRYFEGHCCGSINFEPIKGDSETIDITTRDHDIRNQNRIARVIIPKKSIREALDMLDAITPAEVELEVEPRAQILAAACCENYIQIGENTRCMASSQKEPVPCIVKTMSDLEKCKYFCLKAETDHR